jgi:hypothetical protein
MASEPEELGGGLDGSNDGGPEIQQAWGGSEAVKGGQLKRLIPSDASVDWESTWAEVKDGMLVMRVRQCCGL